MAEWNLRPVGITVVEAGSIQPRLAFVGTVGEHRIRFETTAKGYARLTGRKHPRVKAMRAAYRRRRR